MVRPPSPIESPFGLERKWASTSGFF